MTAAKEAEKFPGFRDSLNICRYCRKPLGDDSVPTHSYWSGIPSRSHAECKESGQKEEAYECQIIDADCNDCKHFLRDRPIGYPKPGGDPNKKSGDAWSGHCNKFDKPTKAYPNFASGHPCFEHRRV